MKPNVLFVGFLVFFFAVASSYAAVTAPAYNGAVNNILATIIQNKAAAAGFAANDPRVVATLNTVSAKVGAAVTATAAIGGTGVSKVSWLSMLLKGVAVAGLAYTLYQGYDLLFNDASGASVTSESDPEEVPPDTQITSGEYPSTSENTTSLGFSSVANYGSPNDALVTIGLSATQCVYQGNDDLFITCVLAALADGRILSQFKEVGACSSNCVYINRYVVGSPTSTGVSSTIIALNPYRTFTFNLPSLQFRRCAVGAAGYPACNYAATTDDPNRSDSVNVLARVSVASHSGACAAGFELLDGVCVSSAPASVTASLIDLPSSLPEAAANQNVDNSLIASFLNNNLPTGSEPVTGAAPLTASTLGPITPADIQVALNEAGQGDNFTVSDLLQTTDASGVSVGQSVGTVPIPDTTATSVVPAPSSGANTQTVPTSTATTTTTATTTASDGVTSTTTSTSTTTLNLGPDPNIGAPSLGEPPSGHDILAPLLGLFPSLKSFEVPAHSSVCPTATFPIFGKSIVMDAHCSLFEMIRDILSAAMLLFWSLVAMFKLLSA
jgi:hypothetical protein